MAKILSYPSPKLPIQTRDNSSSIKPIKQFADWQWDKNKRNNRVLTSEQE